MESKVYYFSNCSTILDTFSDLQTFTSQVKLDTLFFEVFLVFSVHGKHGKIFVNNLSNLYAEYLNN